MFQSFYHCEKFLDLSEFTLKSLKNSKEAKLLPILTELSRLFKRIKSSKKDTSLRPDNVYIACKSFFTGEDDPERPQLEIQSNRRLSNIGDSSDSESDYSIRENGNVDVLGPQQDAQEFLIYLLSELHEEQVKHLPKEADDWNESARVRGKTKNIKVQQLGLKTDHIETSISYLFQGKFRNTFRSLAGKKETSVSTLPFFDIQLEVAPESVKSIEDAFEGYFKGEDIYDDDVKIGEMVSEIEHLPRVLVIQLKRFGFNLKKMVTFKTRKKVMVNDEFEIDEKFLSAKCKHWLRNNSFESDGKYRLFSMIAHEGRSLHSGHYVNYSFDSNRGKWFCFNDEHVSEVSDFESEVRENENAYLLFYELV